MSFTEQEIEEFKAEARELLDVAEKKLLAMDGGEDFRSCYDHVFRSFHNLKGGSGVMEMLSLQAHTHEVENIFMSFKDKTEIPKNYINFFLRGVDAARSILAGEQVNFDYNIERETKPTVQPASAPAQSQPGLDEYIAECEDILERVSKHLSVMEQGTHTKEILDEVYRDVHSLKGASYLFGYTVVGDIAHAMESSMEPLRNGTHKPSKALIDALYNALKAFDAEVECIKNNVTDDKIKSQAPGLAQALLAAAAGLEVILTSVTTVPSNTHSPSDATKDLSKDGEGTGSIRVPVALLDSLMTLMGEMVLVRNQVLQFASNSEDLSFLNLSKRLNSVTSEIQGEMMKTRMQPIGNILSKFNRVVRDLSNDLKKGISLTLSGSETELDKSLLEAIKDPLTHIVRNSCDHGIETPEARRKAGKPEGGNIHVKSYHEGGQVVIEVTDDGKGLHKDVLLKKALEKGLMTQAQAAALNEKEIFNLIFAPGFSTASIVTNVSGRGVGMDVVRTNIERIGGSVELSSIAGKGTTTKLKIPLTLAIVPALLIRCGKSNFAIPQVKLEELVRVDQSSADSKIEYLHGAPVYRLRGNILPLVELNKILNLKSEDDGVAKSVKNIAVLNADNCSFGLIVDEIQDTADIVVKPLNRLLKSLEVYSGATILGDGSFALILDVMGISKVAAIGSDKSKNSDMSVQQAADRRLSELQEFLIVRVDSPTKHAIVLNYVHRLEEFKKSEIEISGSQRVIHYGKSILPILSVGGQLGYPVITEEISKDKICVVVIQKNGTLYGLEVSEIVDTLSTSVEVDTSLNMQSGIFGNLNTQDELVVVVDPFELINKVFPAAVVKPVSAKTVISHEHEAEPVKDLEHLQILLVEDTAFFRRTIGQVLEGAGHTVTVAIDGKDATEILEKNPKKFNLIVSDIEMPRMNGFELAEAVRGNKGLANIPMLAISSRADKKHSDKGLKSGFNIYLEKLKPDILLDAVNKLTNQSRRAS